MVEPRSPAPLTKIQQKTIVFINFQAAVRSAAKASKASQDHGGRLGVALLRSMEVAGESGGVARGPFEHPGSPKESPKKPSGALGGVRDVLRCFAIDLKKIKKTCMFTMFSTS